ncbi:11682_t:CDS:2 [Rhizophagus irregularis]|nr:11682_t:CDS:2 [Rhizophagus irregularis]
MEANEISLPLQTDQQVKKKKPVEIHNYPKEFIIQYSDSKQSYIYYDIIKKENYTHTTYLKYIKGQKVYWIYYRDKFQYHIKSEKLSLNAACLYTKQARDIHQRATVLKSFDNLTSTG